jgi:hypothetical protein
MNTMLFGLMDERSAPRLLFFGFLKF